MRQRYRTLTLGWGVCESCDMWWNAVVRTDMFPSALRNWVYYPALTTDVIVTHLSVVQRSAPVDAMHQSCFLANIDKVRPHCMINKNVCDIYRLHHCRQVSAEPRVQPIYDAIVCDYLLCHLKCILTLVWAHTQHQPGPASQSPKQSPCNESQNTQRTMVLTSRALHPRRRHAFRYDNATAVPCSQTTRSPFVFHMVRMHI